MGRSWLLLGGLAVTAAIAFAWLQPGRDLPTPPAAAERLGRVEPFDALISAAPPGAGMTPGPWQLVDRALAVAARSDSVPLSLDAPSVQALDKAWCAGGAERFDADLRQASASHPASVLTPGLDPGLLDASAWGMQMEALRRATVQRWVSVLRERGDDTSLALAELLLSRGLGLPDAPPGQESRALRLARQTTDPLALATALQMPCPGPAGCRELPIARWAELEPGNLFAWLWRQPAYAGRWTGDSLRTQMTGLLGSEYARSYRQQALQRLLALPQSDSEGLRQQVEISLLSALYFGWQTPSVAPLVNLCSRAGDTLTAQLCERLAEQLWGSDSLLEQQLAIGLVRQLPDAGSSLSWQQRAEQVEALLMAASDVALPSAPLSTCANQAQQRRQLQRLAELGEGRQLLERLQAQGSDLTQLAARWRGSQGRSLLAQRRP